ncbi:MAG: hypothetical protein COB36_00840 [Alphaproteobacteria bacterium]|nr:MAG: hypothetical protein COB36_00840 [Alphaproteobacteria bacterium]
MSDVPKGFITRFFWIGAIGLVFAIYSTATGIHNKNRLERAEAKIVSRFKSLKSYKDKVFLPSIKVAAPDGSIIDLSKSHGKYTILNVWATWCTPCVRELSSLRRLNKTFAFDSDWRIVAVSIDSKSNLSKVAKYTAHYHVENIANYIDYNLELQNHFNIEKLPMTLIVNPSGRILYKIHGDVLWHDKAITGFMDLITKVY